jgi:hypothetical protein
MIEHRGQLNLEGGHQWPFIEEVVSITEDEVWSENEMYSAEVNDFATEFFQNKCENVFNKV